MKNTFDSAPAYLVPEYMLTGLVGRLLTLIEAMGLKENQEKSIKDLVRQEVYESFNSRNGTEFLYPPLTRELYRVEQEIRNDHQKDTQNIPFDGNKYQYSITWKKVD